MSGLTPVCQSIDRACGGNEEHRNEQKRANHETLFRLGRMRLHAHRTNQTSCAETGESEWQEAEARTGSAGCTASIAGCSLAGETPDGPAHDGRRARTRATPGQEH